MNFNVFHFLRDLDKARQAMDDATGIPRSHVKDAPPPPLKIIIHSTVEDMERLTPKFSHRLIKHAETIPYEKV